jgi:hypothetical protein
MLCPRAHVPFCRIKFCLAETILHFCVFHYDASGLWGSYFCQFGGLTGIIPSGGGARKSFSQGRCIHPPCCSGLGVLGNWCSWTGNPFQAWIISATQGKRALVSTAVAKKFCAQTKEGRTCHRLAKYSSEGRSRRLYESEWNVSETWGKCGIPIHISVDIQATTYSLMAVHRDLVRGL